MYLTHKDYEKPVKAEREVPDVTDAIKAFVNKGRKSYEEIVKEVQKSENMTNDEIIAQIKEINLEWYPLVVEEVVE